MSGSNGRRGLSFFGNRKQDLDLTSKKSWLARALRVESLERRDLMASDFSAHHNYIYAQDVTQDFSLTPLDALVVINSLNNSGPISVNPDGPKALYSMDVNLDNMVTAQDALMVINALNLGEGVGEVAEFRYEFYDTAGNLLADPLPDNGVADYQASVGQTVIMRTLAKDIRSSPQGLFAAYHNISYENADNAAVEKLQLQWGDFFRIEILDTTTQGNFVLRFGSGASAQLTAPISPVFTDGFLDTIQTARAIETALTNVFGAGNVQVHSDETLDGSPPAPPDTGPIPPWKFHFNVGFTGALARQAIADPFVESSTLANSANALTTLELVYNSIPDPTTDSRVFRVASDFRFENEVGDPEGLYRGSPGGLLDQPAADTYQLQDFGSVLSSFSLPASLRRVFVRVVETTFVASAAGDILFNGSDATGAGTDILLVGSDLAVPAANVLYPQNVLLRVVNDIQANADAFTVAEDSGASTLNVGANDILIAGTSFGVTAVTQPSNSAGTVTIGTGTNPKTVVFTPAANFFGTTSFSYTITSNLGVTSTATVNVEVTAVNDAPTVVDNTYSIAEDATTPLTITPAELFSAGPLESAQSVTLVANAIAGQTNGTVTVTSGNVVYSPAPNFFGTALFTVTGTDNGSPSLNTTTTVTVTVTPVNDVPIPFSGTLAVNEDTNLIVVGEGAPTNIVTSSQPGPANESSQTVSLVSVSPTSAQGGTLTTNAGIVTYRPAANFFGTDTFTYVITDNGTPALTATGTVTINVASVNDAPDAVDDTGSGAQFVAIGQTGITTTLNPMRNDSAGPLETTDTIKIISIGSLSLGGTATISGNGQTIEYRPANSVVNATESFTYTIEDSGGLRDTATINVLVVPPVLPFAVNDSRTIDEDSAGVTIDVLATDLANAGATKRLLSFTQGTRGVVTLVDNGTPNDQSDDQVRYVPNANEFTTDTFTYTMIDSANGSAESTATVTINFNEINDVPSITDRTASATEDTALTIQGSALIAGLSKGPLEDSQTLVVSEVTEVTQNAGSVELSDGNAVYTPAANFTGTFLFTYRVRDNGTTSGVSDPKTSALGTVTVTVAEANDAPVAGSDIASTNEDTALSITTASLLSNDNGGPNESTQTVSFVAIVGNQSTTQGGTVRMSSDGLSVIYTPAADFNGTDTFTYTIADSGTPSLTATGTVTVTVASINDAPRPTQISKVAFKNLPRNLEVATEIAAILPGPANESTQTVQLVGVAATANTRGTVSLNTDGTIRYVPAANFTGTDTFEYTVRDNGNPAASATSTIVVTVQEFVPSTIRGTVWINDNVVNDDVAGDIDAEELRLNGIKILLTREASASNPTAETFSYLTLSDGTYEFSDLAPGRYIVKIDAQPLMLVDGLDYAGAQGDADNINDQFTINIEAPGGIDASNYNFSYNGIQPGYGNILENLASSFSGRYPGIQQKGIYAAVSKDGKPLWSSKKDGFSNTEFTEVIFSNDGTQLYLTKIDTLHNVLTATVPKNRYVRVNDVNGNRLVRILAESADLVWSQTAPPLNSTYYRTSVDEVLAQEEWD